MQRRSLLLTVLASLLPWRALAQPSEQHPPLTIWDYYIRTDEMPFETLPPAGKVIRLVLDVGGEVNNGGFAQYLDNRSGQYAPLAAEACRTVGAPATAALVEKAVVLVGPKIVWDDTLKRRAALMKLSDSVYEQLSKLDDAFYAGKEDLTELAYAYGLAHQDQIGPIRTS